MVAPALFASMIAQHTAKQTRTVLITGASSGIGHDLAQFFARDAYRIVLTARNKEKLEQLAAELRAMGSPEVHVIPADLADLEAPDALFAETRRRGLDVDVLINNAGFGANGAFAKIDLDKQLDMVQVNVVALVHLTHLYVREMVARRSGRIMNVASTAAFQPGPFMAIYFATKSFVLSFSEALFEELRGTGVTVTALCPGATATNFAAAAGMKNAKLFSGAMDSPTVARIGYRGLMAGRPLVITGAKNRLSAFLVRFGPRSLVRRIVRSMQEDR